MILIFSDPRCIGGVFTWSQYFCRHLYSQNIMYKLIQHYDFDKLCIGRSNICIINNYHSPLFFNHAWLSKLKKDNNHLIFVMHSSLSPANKVFNDWYTYFDSVIVVTLECLEKVKRLYNKNVHYLPNCLNQLVHLQKPKQNRIHFVGRLAPEKNLPMLIYSFTYLSDFSLHLYGVPINSGYLKYLLWLITEWKLTNVTIHDSTNDHNILFACDACVMPSVYEGASYTCIEALEHGIPVIAHKTGGISEYIDETFEFEQIHDLFCDDEIYIPSYDTLLINIGYCECITTCRSKLSNLLDRWTGKVIVPSILLNIKSEKNYFKENALIIAESIKKGVGRDVKFDRKNILYEKNIMSLVNKKITDSYFYDAYYGSNSIQTLRYKKYGLLQKIGCEGDFYKINHIEIDQYDLISIIIPTYNRQNKIEQTILSLLDQSYPNLEIIVVDDGSTDSTAEVIKKYDNIKYIRYEQNMGCYHAVNIGLTYCTGKYVTYHGSDDISEKNRFMTQYKMLKKYDLLMCGANMIRTHIEHFGNNDANKLVELIERDKYDLTIKHYIGCCRPILCFGSFIYKKSVIDELKEFTKLMRGTDAEFISRFLAKYENVVFDIKLDEIQPYKHIYQYVSNKRIGRTYYIIPEVLYYSTDFDGSNLTILPDPI